MSREKKGCRRVARANRSDGVWLVDSGGLSWGKDGFCAMVVVVVVVVAMVVVLVAIYR